MILYRPWLERVLFFVFCLFLWSGKVSEDGHWRRWHLNYDLTKNEAGMHMSEAQAFHWKTSRSKNLEWSKLSRFEERQTCSVNTEKWTRTRVASIKRYEPIKQTYWAGQEVWIAFYGGWEGNGRFYVDESCDLSSANKGLTLLSAGYFS